MGETFTGGSHLPEFLADHTVYLGRLLLRVSPGLMGLVVTVRG
jgi:hypothetical protein